ncbi:MAG: dihydrofolate reductase family protein [Candidatus Sulfotelmatobacter sp.]
MKNIRYGVAMSLDGYIAGPKGEADWIVRDPEVDFGEMWAQYDIGLMGRKTYEPAMARLGKQAFQGMKTVVVSRTMRQADHPEITVISELTCERVQALREAAKKDIWLFGGGELFRSMLDLGEVDGIEVAVMPVVLGGGIPLLPSPAQEKKLTLTKHKVYRSGIVSLGYEVQR